MCFICCWISLQLCWCFNHHVWGQVQAYHTIWEWTFRTRNCGMKTHQIPSVLSLSHLFWTCRAMQVWMFLHNARPWSIGSVPTWHLSSTCLQTCWIPSIMVNSWNIHDGLIGIRWHIYIYIDIHVYIHMCIYIYAYLHIYIYIRVTIPFRSVQKMG